MFKRIMKIAGIVFAGVAVFTGAVIGVMAAMGKFKKKKIYPNRLFFMETEQVVIFDEKNDPDAWYSFVVSGENTESKYDVNQKDCYISFVNKEASSLVDLYDKNKNKLEANQAGRFEVECNEKIYYKVKKQTELFNGSNYGKVVIHALGEELSMVASSKDLTIWIDRVVDTISVNADTKATKSLNNTFATQSIAVATTERLYFDYTSDPINALYPTTKIGENYGRKEVELYYKADITSPYERIDTSSDLSKFNGLVGWDENKQKFYFVSNEASTTGYDFYLATFATYQDKMDYYAELEANPDNEPSVKERLDHMVVTKLNIKTYDVGVKQVSFGAEYVTLDLRNNNLISLTESAQGLTNLKMSMIGSDDKANTSRLGSTEFLPTTEDGLGLVYSGTAMMVDSSNENNKIEVEFNPTINYPRKEISIVKDGVSKVYEIKEVQEQGFRTVSIFGKKLVYLQAKTDSRQFVCANGYLLFDENTSQLSILSAGTYLGLFYLDGDCYEYVVDSDIVDYTIEKDANVSGRWNIFVKDYDLNKKDNIYIKCLAVNSKDAHKYNKIVTSSYKISLQEIGLSFEVNSSFNAVVENNKLTMNVTSSEGDERAFADIVSVGDSVSYNQCVFVTDYISDNIDDYEIFVIPSKFNSTNYVLVGYADGEYFINKVKAIKQINGIETKIYAMQLKTEFGKTIEAVDITNRLTTDDFVMHSIKEDYPITVDVLFKPNAEKIEFNLPDDVDPVIDGKQIYGNQTGYQFTIAGDDSTWLADAGLNKDNFKVYLNDTSVESDKIYNFNWNNKDSKWTFDTRDTFDDVSNYVRIAIVFNGIEIVSDPIYISTTKPEDVNYKDPMGTSKSLYTGSYDTIETNYIDANYDTYKLTLKYDGEIKVDETNILMGSVVLSSPLVLNTENGVEPGFVTDIDEVTQKFDYVSMKKEVFDVIKDPVTGDYSIQINRIGVGYIKVFTESEYVGYLKVEIVDDGNFTLADKKSDESFVTNEFEITSSSVALKDKLSYKYGTESIDGLVDIKNVSIKSFGAGSVNDIIHDEEHKQFTYGGDIILTYENEGNGWEFDRPNQKFSTLELEFDLFVKTREQDEHITFKFNPATKIQFNSEWENQQVYAGTKILLTEESKNNGTESFEKKAYYQITDPNDDAITITDVTLNGSEDKSSEVTLNEKYYTFSPSSTGVYKFTFSNGDSRTITVQENVVALVSGIEFDSEEVEVTFAELKSFDGGVIYGDTVGVYPEDKLESIPAGIDKGLLTIKDQNYKLLKYDNTTYKFSTSAITRLNDKDYEETITLMYNGNPIAIYSGGQKLNKIDIKINNIYNVEETDDISKKYIEAYRERNTEEIITKIDNKGTEKDWEIVGIIISGSSFECVCSDTTISLTNPITSISTQMVTLIIEIDGKEYTYETEIELRPYLPQKNDGYEIYAGDGNSEIKKWTDEFIILDDTIPADKNSVIYYGYDRNIISKIEVGYPNGYSNADKVITFNDDGSYVVGAIVGPQKKIRLNFTFTYKEGGSYVDQVEVIVKNDLTITKVYPYEGLEVDKTPLYLKDAKYSDFTTYYNNEAKLVFEPVNVGQTIYWLEDGYFKDRVSITNKAGVSDKANYEGLKVELIATSENLRSYAVDFASKVVEGQTISGIKFTSDGGLGNNAKGYLVFKLTTNTNSHTYYIFQLAKTTIQANSDLNFDAELTSSENIAINANDKLFNINVADILKKYNGISDVSKASFYLLGYEGIGYDKKHETKPEKLFRQNLEGKTLDQIYNYVTFKIAMIYDYSGTYINAGILSVYAVPYGAPAMKTEADLKPDLLYFEKANSNSDGYFTATISEDATEIECPFEDATGDIDGYTLKASPVSGNLAYASNDDNDTTIEISKYVSDSASFTVRYYYEKGVDPINRFVRYVTYTFEKFDMTGLVGEKSATVGTFNEATGFNNKIRLTTDYIGKYNRRIKINNSLEVDLSKGNLSELSDYDNETKLVNITIGGRTVGLGYDKSDINDKYYYFEFKQNPVQYEMNIPIQYLDVHDPANPSATFNRVIKVTVYKNINMNLSGLGTESNPLLTTQESEGIYNTAYPNFITIKKEQVGTTTVYKYTIIGSNQVGGTITDEETSGFVLYGNEDDQLELSFNNYRFVATESSGVYTQLTESNDTITIDKDMFDSDMFDSGEYYKVYFSHVGPNQKLSMTIKVTDSDGDYYCEGSGSDHSQQTMHLNIQQTYSRLEVSYQFSGADHEVIDYDSGNQKTISLFNSASQSSEFFGKINASAVNDVVGGKVSNDYRFKLYKGDYKIEQNELTTFKNIGFFDASSPNHLTFINGDNYTIDTTNGYAIVFNKPSVATPATFVFKNNYLGDITYSFNLLPGKNGISQASTIINGKQATMTDRYISIIVDDKDANKLETPYLVGNKDLYENIATIKDNENSIYYITSMEVKDGLSTVDRNITREVHSQGSVVYTITDDNDNYVFTMQFINGNINIKLQGKENRSVFDTRTYKFTLYGDGKIVQEYTIVFANYNISVLTNDTITNDPYINLRDKISITKNNGGESISLDSARLISGEYSHSSEKFDTYTNLASYNDATKYITLNTIADQVSVKLTFEVIIGDYSLGYYDYTFTANRNFHFEINGEKVENNIVETNYLLSTNHITGSGYQDKYYEGGTAQVNFMLDNVVTEFSTDLSLKLAKLNVNDQIEYVDLSEMNGIVEVTSSHPEIVKFNKESNSIDFTEDYYDKNIAINLNVKVNLNSYGLGLYEFGWNIKPVGFINMVPKSGIVLGNNNGFASGEFVDLLAPSDTDGSLGIQFFNTTTDMKPSSSSINNISIDTIEIKSMISDKSNSEFNDGSASSVVLYTSANEENNDIKGTLLRYNLARVKLPLVPQSNSTTATHYVTYKVYIKYKANKDASNVIAWEKTHYVTYGVYNPNNIIANGSADNQINVDANYSAGKTYQKDNYDILVFTTEMVDRQPMFTLKETDTFKFADVDNMYIRFAINREVSQNVANTVFEGGNYVYYKLTKSNEKTWDKGTADAEDDVKYFEYTIDISDPKTDSTLTTDLGLSADSTLFNNFLSADFEVMSHDQVITKIKACSSANGTDGFRLYTEKQIKSKAEVTSGATTYKLSDIFMSDEYYFDKKGEQQDASYMHEMVLGFSSDGKGGASWVDGSGYTITKGVDPVGLIRIKYIGFDNEKDWDDNIGNYANYEVYKNTYSKDGTDLYGLSRDFYVIKLLSNIHTQIISPKATFATGPMFLHATKDNFTFKQEQLNVFTMSSGILEASPASGININIDYKIGDVKYTADDSTIDHTVPVAIVGGQIYVSKQFLQAYKNTNQNAKSVILTFNTLKTDCQNTEFMINFALPDLPTLNYSGAVASKSDQGYSVLTINKAMTESGTYGETIVNNGLTVDTYDLTAKSLSSDFEEDMITNVDIRLNGAKPDYVYSEDCSNDYFEWKASEKTLKIFEEGVHNYLYNKENNQMTISIYITYNVGTDTNPITFTTILEYVYTKA
ncbi:MAG: hypothetical protein IKA36_02620 [Clostridia bacterium]|nr:hypothetical protein [Clostridia bacterium]